MREIIESSHRHRWYLRHGYPSIGAKLPDDALRRREWRDVFAPHIESIHAMELLHHVVHTARLGLEVHGSCIRLVLRSSVLR